MQLADTMSAIPPTQARPNLLPEPLAAVLSRLTPSDPRFATDFVAALLRSARDARASDIHLTPTGTCCESRWRLDGVLHPLVDLPAEIAPNIVARLKVLAGLLTYETSLPQEGRIRDTSLNVEVRISTFPSLHGERVVLRLLGATSEELTTLTQLGLPPTVVEELSRQLAATSGAVLIVGPAGSGKTTTAYACLREIVAHSHGGRSIASLEDPIEVAVPSVAQSQVNPSAGFDMAAGLRSLLRLDPEVIFIGEMRDRSTAETALQSALTGQLVVTTFHAGNCDDAIHRLVELGIPNYAVHNALRLVVAQRLVRKLCSCAVAGDPQPNAAAYAMAVNSCRIPIGCEACHQSGYRGRALIAEWRDSTSNDSPIAPRGDDQLWTSATALVEAGITSAQEVFRVLGLRRPTVKN